MDPIAVTGSGSYSPTFVDAARAPQTVVVHKVEVMWNTTTWLPNGTWTDETTNVMGITARFTLRTKDERGNPGGLVDPSGSDVATGRLALTNFPQAIYGNAGRFSAYNTASPLYNYITAGQAYRKPVRIWFGFHTVNGDEIIQCFNGFLSWPTELVSEMRFECDIVGRDNLLMEAKLASTMIYSTRTDIAMAALLQMAGFRDYPGPGAQPVINYDFISQAAAASYSVSATLDVGQFIVPFIWVDTESLKKELDALAQNECGRFHADTDGLFYFRNMFWLQRTAAKGVVWTLDADNLTNIQPNYNPWNLFNSVVIRTNEFTPGPQSEVWSQQGGEFLREARSGGDQTSVTFYAKLRNPVTSIIPPYPGKDYLGMCAASGDDMTNKLVVTLIDVKPQLVTFSITNTDQNRACWVFPIRLRGFPLISRPARTAITSSANFVGLPSGGRVKELTQNMFTQTLAAARLRSNFVSWLVGQQRAEFVIPDNRAMPALRLGDLVQFTIPRMGSNVWTTFLLGISFDWSSNAKVLSHALELLDSASYYASSTYYKVGGVVGTAVVSY